MRASGRGLFRSKRSGVFAVVNAMDRVSHRPRAGEGNENTNKDSVAPHAPLASAEAPYFISSLQGLSNSSRDEVTFAKDPLCETLSLGLLQDAFRRFLKQELTQLADAHRRISPFPASGDVVTKEPESGGSPDFQARNRTTEHVNKSPGAGSEKETRLHRSALMEAAAAYNPTIDPVVVRRVERRINLRKVLGGARKLRKVLQEVGSSRFVGSVLPQWKAKLEREWGARSATAAQYSEERAGIVGRLSPSAGGRRQQRLRAFVQHPSDFQVNEVLPSGRIVTFAEPTVLHDGNSIPSALNASLNEALKAGQGGQTDGDGSVVFLHFVLYREAIPLEEAFCTLAGFCQVGSDGNEAPDVSVADFAVNAPVEDAMVSVQTCSLRVTLQPGLAMSEKREQCRGLCRTLAHVNLSKSKRQPELRVQLLGWRTFPCSAKFGALCGAQYTMMLRGVFHHGGHQEALALGAAQCVPNFFGPGYFGPVGCPFRHFDVAAAVERGWIAEAALMTVVMACWRQPKHGDLESSPQWLKGILGLLVREEDRPGALRERLRSVVPETLQARARDAKAALLWNVVVSSRARSLSGGDRAGMLAARPEPGDFVQRHVASEPGQTASNEENRVSHTRLRRKRRLGRSLRSSVPVKPELLPPAALASAFREMRNLDSAESGSDSAVTVIPVYSDDEAAPFSVFDVVAPVDVVGGLNALAAELGFLPLCRRPLSGRVGGPTEPPVFRPIFCRPSGFPRTANLWVKEFMEPTGVQAVREPGSVSEYKLSTDLDFATVSPGGRVRCRDYAERSRGLQASVWPIGSRGRSVADRLPPGLLTSAALSHAGPSVSAVSRRNVSRSLVLQFTLPAGAYCSSYLREFVVVENRCPTSSAPPLLPPPRAVKGPLTALDDDQLGAKSAPQNDEKPSGERPNSRYKWSEGNILSLARPRSHRA